MSKTAHDITTLPKRYDELVDLLPPRPIRSQSKCDVALKMIDLMAGHKLTRDQDDYLDALCTFVANYEDDNDIIPEGTPLDALRVLMQSHGMSAYEFGKLLGDPSLGSKILRNERDLSKAHIRKLT